MSPVAHGVYGILNVRVAGPCRLHVEFDDGTAREIDFTEVVEGDIFSPLKDAAFFARAELDPEAHTVVWLNGADLDPETLHDWPQFRERMVAMASPHSPRSTSAEASRAWRARIPFNSMAVDSYEELRIGIMEVDVRPPHTARDEPRQADLYSFWTEGGGNP
jgi:hypothetical protein